MNRLSDKQILVAAISLARARHEVERVEMSLPPRTEGVRMLAEAALDAIRDLEAAVEQMGAP